MNRVGGVRFEIAEDGYIGKRSLLQKNQCIKCRVMCGDRYGIAVNHIVLPVDIDLYRTEAGVEGEGNLSICASCGEEKCGEDDEGFMGHFAR